MSSLRIVFLLLLWPFLQVQGHAQTPWPVGVRSLSFPSPARAAPVAATLWYPSVGDTSSQLVGGNRVFVGVSAHRDATMASGRFPLVLLAHGGLRAARYGGSWIAADLAARGFLVWQVHPPVLRADAAHRAGPELWLRPLDLSAALSAAGNDAALQAHATPGFAAIVGFLRGGTSALVLAGARFDADRVHRSCDAPASGPDCRWFRAAGVDWRQLPAESIGADYRDPRVRVAIAVAPELEEALSMPRRQDHMPALHVMRLGPIVSEPGPSLVPGTPIPDATVMGVFNQCTPGAEAALRAEGDGVALCADGGGRPRSAIHAELAERIAAALEPARRTP